MAKFRSYEVREGPNFNPPIWQVIRATLAHPNAFPGISIGPKLTQQVYISGEIGWNNPSNEVIREFEAQWKDGKIACLASIGAGHEGVVRIDDSTMFSTFDNAVERTATDCEKVSEEVAYRFRGKNSYFRLSVEQGLQLTGRNKLLTLEEVLSCTSAYLSSSGVSISVDALVESLLQDLEIPEWWTMKEHFKEELNAYISNAKECANKLTINEVKSAGLEIVHVLETIGVSSSTIYDSESEMNRPLRAPLQTRTSGIR